MSNLFFAGFRERIPTPRPFLETRNSACSDGQNPTGDIAQTFRCHIVTVVHGPVNHMCISLHPTLLVVPVSSSSPSGTLRLPIRFGHRRTPAIG
jgi:hypothetical protein